MRRFEEQLSKAAFVPAGFEAFVLDTELGASILFEPCEGGVTQHAGQTKPAGQRNCSSACSHCASVPFPLKRLQPGQKPQEQGLATLALFEDRARIA